MSSLFTQTDSVSLRRGRFARIAVERGIDRVGRPSARRRLAGDADDLEGTLTYRCADDVEIGERVEVPLGRGTGPRARSAGIVVQTGGAELLGRIDPDRVKPILARTGARLPPSLVSLARWMSTYYVCPLGMVLATMMPAAVKRATGLKRRTLVGWGTPDLSVESVAESLKPSARAAWAAILALGPDTLPLPPRDLAARIGARTLAPINKLIRAGLLAHEIHDEVSALPAAWERWSVEQSNGRDIPLPGRLQPTGPQQSIIDGVSDSAGQFGVHLLRGITGSGKTEVYLGILQRLLSGSGSPAAIVLVPEISLTPQTAGRFIQRFGGPGGVGGAGVAVLHSGLTAAQRHKQWAAVASGRARIVIGARSAVFAPIPRAHLIIVDEEHASDYKQDQLPRYHARDVAIKRAQLDGCPVLLGSATPSLESWANATAGTSAGAPKYRLWELNDRVGGGSLPHVDVVDILKDRQQGRTASETPAGHPPQIGPTLSAALARTLDDGGQAILLLNRRGYSHYICCPSSTCGWVFRCDQCEASMVSHRAGFGQAGGYLRCHHCLSEQKLERQCPVCGRRIIALGAGTQRVEDELGIRFGLIDGQGLIRVDGDSMHSAADYFEALARFATGQARVLLGTQMIAKGLDYPNVRLVGVIDGDTAIALPDFRAAERTFQLISQVAGRAGRGNHPGRVIVQTVNPTFPAIRLAAAHDYRAFADAELRTRRRSGLPPAARMARIVVRDKDHTKALRAATDIADALRQASHAAAPAQDRSVRIEGPADCPIARIAGFHRIGIEVIGPARGTIQSLFAALRSRGLLKSDARTAVDVDPISMM